MNIITGIRKGPIMPTIAYLTAEIGLWSELHTYSGGLGVLAGDHVKSAADANLPLVAISLLYREDTAANIWMRRATSPRRTLP